MSKKIAIIIHNLTLYYTIKQLYLALLQKNHQVDLYIVDNYIIDDWRKMAAATYEEVSQYNQVLHATEYNGEVYDLALYPYLPYDFEVNSLFNMRYQYGMAKPEWNFQPSTLLFDACLCYGHYDYQFLQHYCLADIVGNLKYAHLSETDILQKSKILNTEQGVSILYLPTYGKESSIEKLCEPLLTLPDNWTLSIKLHHGIEFLESDRLSKLTVLTKVKIYGQNEPLEDLILNSDIVISDGSSACFDAIYFNKPLIIAGNYFGEHFEEEMPITQQLYAKYKLYHFTPDKNLKTLIQDILMDNSYIEKIANLRDYFFPIRGPESLAKAIKVIEDLTEKTEPDPYKQTKTASKKWHIKKNQQLNQCLKDLEIYKQELENKKQELYSIYTSRAWKVTIALRKIRCFFNKYLKLKL